MSLDLLSNFKLCTEILMLVAHSVKRMKEKILGLINDPELEKTNVNFLNI